MMVKRLEKKKLILNAAMDCFSQMGYDKTTLDEIGGKVNLNKASLYYYYNSKEDLFSDVIYAEAAQFLEEVKTKLKTIHPLEEKVVFFLLERRKFYHRLSEMHFVPVHASNENDPLLNVVLHSIQLGEKSLLSSTIKDGMRPGEIHRMDPERLAEVLLKVSTAFKSPASSQHALNGNSKLNGNSTTEDVNAEDIRLTTRLILRGVRSES
ncbi:MAG: TetR/AcrR family transcriptional regulator [Bacteroidetes bacterium]|nr:TetR/AcrR family transcriptional regulator [Bacteroidota bacterium]